MPAPAAIARLGHVAPFFIVRDVLASVAFYRDCLGFEVAYLGPDDGPFFAIVQRDGVHLMFKAIAPEVPPAPNPSRHAWASWDAYVHTPDAEALAAEFKARGVMLHAPLGVNADRLFGFEVQDADGYVLYFGRPASPRVTAPVLSTTSSERDACPPTSRPLRSPK